MKIVCKQMERCCWTDTVVGMLLSNAASLCTVSRQITTNKIKGWCVCRGN